MERPPDVYSESFTACKEFVRVVPAPVTVKHKSKCATKQPSKEQKNAEKTPDCCNKCFPGIVKTIIAVFSPPCSFGNEDTSVVLGSLSEVKTQEGLYCPSERWVSFYSHNFSLFVYLCLQLFHLN